MRDHKSLLAWQEANAVARTVMLATRAIRHPCIDQLQRAALSVQLNIAEGYALKSPKRFRNHLDIAYGSAVETAELLELSLIKRLRRN
jgi:four helix bundle protein